LKINSWDPAQDGNLEKVFGQIARGEVVEHEEVAARMEPKNSVESDASSLDLGSGRGLRKHRELSLRENTRKCAVLLVVLGFWELVFLSWVFGSNLPRRSADIDAFMRYQGAPTERNKDLWLKEREKDTK
jgi:hypothetical protein